MSISDPFIRRPVGTTLLAIGLFLLGVVAYAFLPVASLPAIDFPTIGISASRPGADPETMAASVAAPLERRLANISGLVELTSSSSLGNTQIIAQFDLDRNIDSAARDVQAAINAAETDLPSDLSSLPTFRKTNSSTTPIIVLALTSKHDADERGLRRDGHGDRPAHLAGRRRRRRGRGRRRAAGDPRADRSLARRRHGPRARAGRGGDRQRECAVAHRRFQRGSARRDARHDRISSIRPRTTAASWSPPRMAGWCASATSRPSIAACAIATRPAGTTARRRSFSSSSSSPAPMSWRRSTTSRPCCRSCSNGYLPGSRSMCSPTARRRSAPASPTSSARC